ncbi:hypothetical protein C7M84_023759 [Penaeus vannamei]|uniref:Uncharacterized protein n=1 Tax=Penaeus vannamei TaxID=6689 RepID=A0A3R7NC00_PENVA|nr:hypothetical protein C7M84_023759 [Penaeus vannamei]
MSLLFTPSLVFFSISPLPSLPFSLTLPGAKPDFFELLQRRLQSPTDTRQKETAKSRPRAALEPQGPAQARPRGRPRAAGPAQARSRGRPRGAGQAGAGGARRAGQAKGGPSARVQRFLSPRRARSPSRARRRPSSALARAKSFSEGEDRGVQAAARPQGGREEQAAAGALGEGEAQGPAGVAAAKLPGSSAPWTLFARRTRGAAQERSPSAEEAEPDAVLRQGRRPGGALGPGGEHLHGHGAPGAARGRAASSGSSAARRWAPCPRRAGRVPRAAGGGLICLRESGEGVKARVARRWSEDLPVARALRRRQARALLHEVGRVRPGQDIENAILYLLPNSYPLHHIYPPPNYLSAQPPLYISYPPHPTPKKQH